MVGIRMKRWESCLSTLFRPNQTIRIFFQETKLPLWKTVNLSRIKINRTVLNVNCGAITVRKYCRRKMRWQLIFKNIFEDLPLAKSEWNCLKNYFSKVFSIENDFGFFLNIYSILMRCFVFCWPKFVYGIEWEKCIPLIVFEGVAFSKSLETE